MQYHWLNKQNNNKLIIFFAGWSFDEKPFEFLECEDFDVLMLYDYNSVIENEYEAIQILNNSNNYKQKYLIAWSMGVYTAYILKDKLSGFTKKIAINGTPYPVHNEFGIPEKPFLLTLRHARTGLEGKFYQNIFDKTEEFERYMLNPVQRTIENRESELKSLYKLIKETDVSYEKFYDKALISSNDKIVPTKNQINFYNDNNTDIKLIESGHFPYYNFKNWNEILCR